MVLARNSARSSKHGARPNGRELHRAATDPNLEPKYRAGMIPFFAINPAVVNGDGKDLPGEAEGFLVIKKSWAAKLRTVAGDHKPLETTYFERLPATSLYGSRRLSPQKDHCILLFKVNRRPAMRPQFKLL